MVVPVDTDIDEAEHIAEKHRQQGQQCVEMLAVRHLQFQHHDGDDDGNHAITECLDASLFHGASAMPALSQPPAWCQNGTPTIGVEACATSRSRMGRARRASRPDSTAKAKARAIAAGSPASATAVLTSTAS
ncbi:hypothetical protein GALL_376390 [mine drainage metagenome]|uniref:Uncharacterized protein n=1 Tax=mine drainage metagenome TaxID=410659 RepID=A0A1J5QKW0_9ZZZZ